MIFPLPAGRGTEGDVIPRTTRDPLRTERGKDENQPSFDLDELNIRSGRKLPRKISSLWLA